MEIEPEWTFSSTMKEIELQEEAKDQSRSPSISEAAYESSFSSESFESVPSMSMTNTAVNTIPRFHITLNQNESLTMGDKKAGKTLKSTGYLAYTLFAPTSGFARRGEDTLTYLNKDQHYNLKLDYQDFPRSEGNLCQYSKPKVLTSLISLQFSHKDTQNEDEALKTWELWASRQSNFDLQALRVFSKPDESAVLKIDDIAHNGVRITWTPAYGPVIVRVVVRCLSTDFSNQKGVKGIPLHLQIDSNDSEMVRDRALAQIKTFCEKGADRKMKEEEKRILKTPNHYPCQVSKPTTVFMHVANIMGEPILFSAVPHIEGEDLKKQPPEIKIISSPRSRSPKAPKVKRPRISSGPGTSSSSAFVPFFIFVRQENEEIFTPLCIKCKNLEGIIEAIATKFQVNICDIRHIFKRASSGPIIHVDPDFVSGLAGEFFLMKALVVERLDFGCSPVTHEPSHFQFDIILCEI